MTKLIRPHVSLTVDVESYGSDDEYHFAAILDELLEELDVRGIKATFFVNGCVLPRWREKITELHKAGHFIGSHGWDHIALVKLGPERSKIDIERSYYEISSLIDDSLIGYRAPYFSLTEQTPWASDMVLEAGFAYSSSVLPGKNPQYAFPGAPLIPFKWPNGLPEFPVPVMSILGYTIPAIGGGYLRILPKPLINSFLFNRSDCNDLWTYCHPYDFSGTIHMPVTPNLIMKRVIKMRRKLMMPRILDIVSRSASSMQELVNNAEYMNSLEFFSNKKVG